MEKLFLLALFISAVTAFPWIDKERKIVGGVDAESHQAPYMVSMQVFRQTSQEFRHTCGGSIIRPTWILTAAHCITENGLDLDYRIVAGEHNFEVSSGNEQIREVLSFILHADYEGGVNPFDIALLAIDPLSFITGIVETIDLPPRGVIPTGTVRLFGWGSTSTTDEAQIPSILQTVEKPVLSLEMCREVLDAKYPGGTPLHYTNVCTGPLETSVTACSGDSGGPIVQPGGDGELEVVGIASWISAFPCGAINAVTVYVRTSAFIDWIMDRID